VVGLGVFLAAVAGDQVGYLIGRRIGPRLFNRPDSRLFSRAHAERARAFFDRRGARAVLLARFVPVVRTFVPVVAGVGRMPYGRFTAYNVIGGLVWGVGILGAGFLLGGVPVMAGHVELMVLALLALSLVPGTIGLLRHRARPIAGIAAERAPASALSGSAVS
jgi:membrane-associated protein